MNKGFMLSQSQFNKLMETYEEANYSLAYDIAVNLIRIINLLGIFYLVTFTL